MTAQSPTDAGWAAKAKGSARIHTHPDVTGAIVDRRGFGVDAALGHNVTWAGKPFVSVRAAKEAALAKSAK